MLRDVRLLLAEQPKMGGYAYKYLFEIIIALSRSFDIFLNDGIEKTFFLNRPNYIF
jgi:hypothetical protein